MKQAMDQKKFRVGTILFSVFLLSVIVWTGSATMVRADSDSEYREFKLRAAFWNPDRSRLVVRGVGNQSDTVELEDASSGLLLGFTRVDSEGRWRIVLRNPTPVPCTIQAGVDGRMTEKAVSGAPADCDGNSQPVAMLSGISISGPVVIDENSGMQYNCVANYDDGSSKDVTAECAWSENSVFASIDGSGYLATSAVSANRSFNITATYTGMSDTIGVTIQNQIAGLTGLIISGPDTLEAGLSAQYSATATYSDGSSQAVSSGLNWSVDNGQFATIALGGVLTAAHVNTDQTVAINASYTQNGVTRLATTTVTIKAAAAPDEPPLTGSHANRITTYAGTKTCLACHTNQALEVHASVHYQWQGDATEAIGLDAANAGKMGGINDFCIYPDINWIGKLTNVDGVQVDGGCAKCHAGLGEKPSAEPTQSQLENIDCLVCHSSDYKRTVAMVDGSYRFVPDSAKMTVSINQAAADITLPSKDSCLNCHTKAGGGNNFKRGDIAEAHRNPSRSFDVHMSAQADGGAGLSCLDCHKASGHKIAGRGTDLRPREMLDQVSCSNCHSGSPHGSNDIDKHTARVNCTVCHIPSFAKAAATDMDRDWSQPGDLVASSGLYEPHHAKGSNVTPEYRFFNGLSHFYQFGDPAVAGDGGRVVMSAPDGQISDPGAKIHAFKRHLGKQPMDPVTKRLLPLKIGKFFETGQLQTAVEMGAAAVGWTYSGHEFAETERYMGLFHEVAPKEDALSCNSCHNGGSRLDFAALGYTPKTTNNGRPLCSSCHGQESASFTRIHDKHVRGEGYDCSRCHNFSQAN